MATIFVKAREFQPGDVLASGSTVVGFVRYRKGGSEFEVTGAAGNRRYVTFDGRRNYEVSRDEVVAEAVHCPGSLNDGYDPAGDTARCGWCCTRMTMDDRGLIPSHDTIADRDEGVAEADAPELDATRGLEAPTAASFALAWVEGVDVDVNLVDDDVIDELVTLVGPSSAGEMLDALVAANPPRVDTDPEPGLWVDTGALGDELVAALTDAMPDTTEFVVVARSDWERLMAAAADAGLEDAVGNFDVVPVELDRL